MSNISIEKNTVDSTNEYFQASVTVFFSLVILIVIALVGTTLEITRAKICNVHAYRVLKSASESLMTEYSRPLYINHIDKTFQSDFFQQ